MKSYYIIRWKRFFEETYQALVEDKEIREKKSDEMIGNFEIEWNYVNI